MKEIPLLLKAARKVDILIYQPSYSVFVLQQLLSVIIIIIIIIIFVVLACTNQNMIQNMLYVKEMTLLIKNLLGFGLASIINSPWQM